VAQKQYEALRMFFREGVKAKKVAHKFGYTYRGFTTIVSEFRKKLQNPDIVDPFFIEKNKGRKTSNTVNEAKDMIVEMRKKYYSVEDIKVALDSKGMVLSERGVHEVLRREGFGRLPRRSSYLKSALEAPRIEAEKSQIEDFDTIQEFKSNAAGILCLLPLLKDYGIDELIGKSQYPETSVMGRLNSILSFVALKTCGVKRYSADDLWCMDRGLGAFSGLNVLPKAAWFSSYSHRVTQQMNFWLSQTNAWIVAGKRSFGRYCQPGFYNHPLLGRGRALGKQLVWQTGGKPFQACWLSWPMTQIAGLSTTGTPM
jgi:hypothetical protein